MKFENDKITEAGICIDDEICEANYYRICRANRQVTTNFSVIGSFIKVSCLFTIPDAMKLFHKNRQIME